MGLDMYLEGRTYNWSTDKPKKDGFEVRGVILELGYWRKHPNLHGYIVQQFAGGVDECQEIQLTAEQIKQIIAAIKAKELPHTTGFFFGESNADDDAPSIATFEKALAWMENATPPGLPQPEKLGDSGLVVIPIKAEDFEGADESRYVYYHASW